MQSTHDTHNESLSGAQAAEHIRHVAKTTRVCLFGTDLQHPPLTVCPMAVQSADEDGVLWFLSPRSSLKNRHIEQDPHVQILFSNPDKAEFMTLQGIASISDDRALREAHWTPMARTWFTGGVDDPELTVIRVDIRDGYYWDTRHGKMVSLLKIAVGAMTGTTHDDGVQGQVRL